MRHLLLATALLVPSSSFAQPAPRVAASAAAKVDCISNRVQHADRVEALRPQRLDRLPPGTVYLSVMRQIDGCQIPVLASEERARRR